MQLSAQVKGFFDNSEATPACVQRTNRQVRKLAATGLQNGLSLPRQSDLDPVLWCGGQQLVDLFLRGRWCRGGAGRDGLADLEEHLFQAGRSDRNQHSGWLVRFVLESVRRADWHVRKRPGAGHEALAANR